MSNPKRGNSFLDFLRGLMKNRPSERALAAITNGSRWNSLIARVPPNYYQYKPGSIRRAERDGILFDLDLSEYMQWLIFFGVETEPRDVLYNLVKPGSTVIDVGANIGETALKFSRLTGPNGSVVAFEPFPETFARLQHHLMLNHTKNIIPVNAALGNAASTLRMSTVAGNSGGNQISDKEGNTEVSVLTLDSWLDAHPQIHPSLIKIDVEGYELKVLQGAKQSLKKFRPVLFLEANPGFLQRAGDNAESLTRFLGDCNYRLRDAEDGNQIRPGEKLLRKHQDIIAEPN